MLEYSAPLLQVGGYSVAWKGALSDEERAGGHRAAELLGMEITDEIKVEPFAGARERRLVIARKVAETPERFPRREGMAQEEAVGGAGSLTLRLGWGRVSAGGAGVLCS